jgi:hypothetical protein
MHALVGEPSSVRARVHQVSLGITTQYAAMSRGSRWACCIHRKLTLYVQAVICPQNRNAWSVRAALVGSLQRKVNLNVLHKLKLVQATPKEENRFHANPLLSITCRLQITDYKMALKGGARKGANTRLHASDI